MDRTHSTTIAVTERRRHPRFPVCEPVTLIGKNGVYGGDILNLSFTGILVQCLGELPELDEELQVTLHLPLGEVTAQGRVSRLEPENYWAAVELTHVGDRGDVLLATLVMAGGAMSLD